MSTQRREDRWRHNHCTGRGVLCRRLGPEERQRAGLPGRDFPAPIVQFGSMSASGGTAPPDFSVFHPNDEDLSLGTPVWLATNSPHSDHRLAPLVLLARLVQFVQLLAGQIVRQGLRQGSPPFGARLLRATGTPASHGLSLPHLPLPTGITRLHWTSPRVPAGICRWAERYDGKRDMYLEHAA